jgi:CheY-like chemotaxis protein
VSKKKIMIADDDASILEAMQVMLEDEGYEVIAELDGKVVQDMRSGLPDLLILDVWMSGVDGTGICRHLKSENRTKHIPIILCSANRDTQKIAKECDADDFIAKPFEMIDFLNKIKEYTNE